MEDGLWKGHCEFRNADCGMIKNGRWAMVIDAGWKKKQIRTPDYQWADYQNISKSDKNLIFWFAGILHADVLIR